MGQDGTVCVYSHLLKVIFQTGQLGAGLGGTAAASPDALLTSSQRKGETGWLNEILSLTGLHLEVETESNINGRDRNCEDD